MVRFDENDRHVRRRYSVRGVDESSDTLTLWMTTDHEGPGSRWVQTTSPGDLIEVIGPRGKILLNGDADWHLFVGDVSALAAFYRMAEHIELPGRALFIVEIDASDDAQGATFDSGLDVSAIFVDRRGRLASDPTGLLNGLAALEMPPGRGHAYIFGEFHATRVVCDALVDRGLEPTQLSHKAFWRSGRSNADHGEPIKREN
jgi:NADPH-dependent ferric siderophore reductase